MKKRLLAAVAGTLLTGACATAQTSSYAEQSYIQPITGSAPVVRGSRLEAGFQCVREDLVNSNRTVRIAVSEIKDATGKFNYEGQSGGTLVTQGASAMTMTALGYFGPQVRQVERLDTRIPEVELGLARQQMLRDGQQTRPVLSGSYEGTDYYISGAVTEVNMNIRSGGAEFEVQQIGAGRRVFVMDVVVDLRLIRTSDMTIVGAPVRVEKQIRGFETKAGIFNFFGDYLVDLNVGEMNQEPVQLGVRTALEMGVLELVPRAFDTSFDRCREYTDASFAG